MSTLRQHSRVLVFALAIGLLAAACGAEAATTQSERPVPTVTPLPQPTPEPTNEPEPTPLPAEEPAAAPTEAPTPEESRVRSFQEYLPDAASIEERYNDGGLWSLTDIRYLEPGPRIGEPCGDTQPANFNGIEVVYSNVSGENLLVMVQQGEGVDIWMQGVAEGVECTELGIRVSELTVPDADQSVVLEIDPTRPQASMAVAGALEGDVFISFVAGAFGPDSPVANPQPLVDFLTEMFDRIEAG